MIIAVGTENHIKVKAVEQAAQQLFSEAQVIGKDVGSGVSPQPRTDTETRKGAFNRARRALKEVTEAQLGIGIEGGVHPTKKGLMGTVWVCVVDRETQAAFFASGGRYYLPPRIAHAIASGKEMGPALDEITGDKDTKKKQGTIGIITKGVIDRTTMYAHVILIALGLWYGRDWEDDLNKN